MRDEWENKPEKKPTDLREMKSLKRRHQVPPWSGLEMMLFIYNWPLKRVLLTQGGKAFAWVSERPLFGLWEGRNGASEDF